MSLAVIDGRLVVVRQPLGTWVVREQPTEAPDDELIPDAERRMIDRTFLRRRLVLAQNGYPTHGVRL